MSKTDASGLKCPLCGEVLDFGTKAAEWDHDHGTECAFSHPSEALFFVYCKREGCTGGAGVWVQSFGALQEFTDYKGDTVRCGDVWARDEVE